MIAKKQVIANKRKDVPHTSHPHPLNLPLKWKQLFTVFLLDSSSEIFEKIPRKKFVTKVVLSWNELRVFEYKLIKEELTYFQTLPKVSEHLLLRASAKICRFGMESYSKTRLKLRPHSKVTRHKTSEY